MSRVITFSRVFPSYHPKAGQETYFIEKFWQSLYNDGKIDNCLGSPLLEKELEVFSNPSHFIIPKYHTIRAGNRWEVGDKFSPRVWSGKPYQSKQITIASDIEIKKLFDFEFLPAVWIDESKIKINGKEINSRTFIELANNDGLEPMDLLYWFGDGYEMSTKKRKSFSGQIICWSDKINY